MNKIKIFLLTLLVLTGLAGFTAPIYAADTAQGSVCEGISDSATCTEDQSGVTVSKLVRTIIRILSYIIGAVSVIMVIIGSLKYVTSRGESASVTSAKNTIIYALIGLVIAVLAQGIVRYVIREALVDPSAPTAPAPCEPNAANGFSCPR